MQLVDERLRRDVRAQYAKAKDGLRVLEAQLDAIASLPEFSSARALSAAVRVLSEELSKPDQTDHQALMQLNSVAHVLSGLGLAIDHVIAAARHGSASNG